jgi:hypothetical protein
MGSVMLPILRAAAAVQPQNRARISQQSFSFFPLFATGWTGFFERAVARSVAQIQQRREGKQA